MKVAFSQVYFEVGAAFPFSVHFQRFLTREVTDLVRPSHAFTESYGTVRELIFRISAKHKLGDNEIRGPSFFRKAHQVEFTVFLPFDLIVVHADAPRHALYFLLKGVSEALDLVEIDKSKLIQKSQSLIDSICADRIMLDKPSWNESENNTIVRKRFEEFFASANGEGYSPPRST
jgi:hypothetical protein